LITGLGPVSGLSVHLTNPPALAGGCLVQASVAHIISAYKIKYGVLVVDDSDRERSKNAVDIGGLHKIRDKKKPVVILMDRISYSYY